MVERIDARMRALVDGLERSGHLDDTLIVLTADHGYALGEGNRYLAGQCCAELQVRVPMLVYLPGSTHAGARVAQNVSAVDVVPTILDVLAPDHEAIVGGRSLLGLLYDPQDPRQANEHAVYTLGLRVHMIRQGDLKLHWNEWRATQLVVDVAADPSETHPIVLGEPRERLAALLDRERQRHALLAASVSSGDSAIDPEIVVALAGDVVDEDAVEPFLERFWERSAETQRALLQAIVRHRLDGLDDALAALGGEGHENAGHLLVTQAFIGARGACDRLGASVEELGPEARVWLGELFPKLPSRCKTLALEPLLAAIGAVRATSPPLESVDGHFLALAGSMLAQDLEAETPREVKELLRDLYNEAVVYPTRYRIQSLLERVPFDRRVLLRGLEPSVTPADVDVLAGLGIDKYSAAMLTRLIVAFDTPASRALLVDIANGPLEEDAAQAILRELRRSDGVEEVRVTVVGTLGQRFPILDASI
jgi:hypothetical protein